MKILVTGGAGFIGSHLVDAFIKKGHDVLIFDNLSTGKKENLNPKAKFFNVDITSTEAREIIKKEKPEVLDHHAAQINLRFSVEDPLTDAKSNILGFINLLEAGKNIYKKVIFASTGGALYGDADVIPTPETYEAKPLSPYGIAKLTGEHYLYYYQKIYHLPHVILRYANVYGPRQNPHGEAGVVAIFCEKFCQNQQPIINGKGKQTRDFVYVSDVVDANLRALDDKKSETFNIGTAKETDVNKIFSELKKAFNSSFPSVHVAGKAGEQKRSCLNYQKARKILGWQPKVILEEGLKLSADFFRNR